MRPSSFIFSLFFIFLFSSCVFFKSRQDVHYKSVEKIKPIDVIIVPGLPLYGGKWDTLLKARIIWSGFLYKKGIASKILYSGNAVYTPWKEGPSMALYAVQLGIKNEHILIDTIAEHSTENLYYGYQLAKAQGCKTIAVATDPFQCAMLQKFAKKNFKEEIYFLPIIYDSIRSQMNIDLSIDTTATRSINFVSLEQRQGYHERLNGTRGRHIKKE
ncbi:MAG: YdcF family protein [Bacteroidia bacterium]